MTPSEIAFLGVGLAGGAAVGAALSHALRASGVGRREVRLTITPHAIPARIGAAPALASPPLAGPMPGSPEEGALLDGVAPGPVPPIAVPPAPREGPRSGGHDSRTPVPSGSVALAARTVAASPAVASTAAAGPRPVAAPGSVSSPPPVAAPGAAAGPRAVAAPGSVASPGPVAVAPGPFAPAVRPGLSLASAPPSPVVIATGPTRAAAPRKALTAPGCVAPATVAPGGTTRRPPVRSVPGPAATAASAPGPAASAAPERGSATAGAAATAPVRLRPPTDAPPAAIHLDAVPVIAATRPLATADEGDGVPDRPAAAGNPAPSDDGPCADPRRAVTEKCALAGVTREQARVAADALREAQLAWDILRDRVDRAEVVADPRRVSAEKDRLHADFRAASDRAGTPDETEAAARAWLGEINRLNAAVRDALRAVEQGTAELRSRGPALDRLSAEADAARIAAENAEAGCRDAREALAACEEAAERASAGDRPDPEPHPFDGIWPEDRPNLPAPAAPGSLQGLPVVVRLLRGDRDARDRLVAALAGGDADAERDWGLRVSRFVDAIVGRAIEDGYLDLPEDDPFWRLFGLRECRDIVGALSALGFRYDGLGGFADGRVPAARDLSLAVGYAGLDRMRIRTWPREADIGGLFAEARVAADEWLADQAGDLSLGRLVDALGARAAELADVWNAWGRVRPLLLAA